MSKLIQELDLLSRDEMISLIVTHTKTIKAEREMIKELQMRIEGKDNEIRRRDEIISGQISSINYWHDTVKVQDTTIDKLHFTVFILTIYTLTLSIYVFFFLIRNSLLSDHTQFLAILYQALSTPIGLKLPTSDITKCRAKLYAARAQSKDPSLSILEFRAAPSGNAIFIVKGRKSDDA